MMHKDTRHEPSDLRTETVSNNHESWITRNFNYKCYITYLTGFYSCLWTFQQWEKTKHGSCCCSWKEQIFYVIMVSSCILSIIILFVWIETSNEYFSFDWVVYLGTGLWFFWSIVLLSLFVIMTAYTSLLLIVSFLLLWERIELTLHMTHKVLVLVSITVCMFLMYVLCQYWKDKWLIAGLSLRIFAPFLHLGLITVMVIVSWPISIFVSHLESEALQLAAGLSFLLILLCLYLIPLGIYSPCIQEEKNLGPKPVFFGHRGAPMIAPENTMMAFEKAVEYDASGLETDVYLSYDNVPFIMHDYDLSRTTNIREVLPTATYNHTSLFKWPFLSTLNAGKWFLERKPFLNMDPLSEADKKKASMQWIPQLADVLQLAKKENKFVLFDLYGPPAKHPYRNSFIRSVVRVILDSKIEQHLIFWLPGSNRNYVRFMAPGFQHVGRLLSIEHLASENISIINVDYKRLFYSGLRAYKAANIYINIYIVNEPWLYSLAWCSRIDSVTTDNIQQLSRLNHPHFFMTPGYYMTMWILMDCVSAILISVIFYFQWWRELKKKRWLEPTSAPRDTQSIILSKDKNKSKGSTRLPITPPSRIEQSPWILPTLPSSSTKGVEKYSKFLHSDEAPKKKPMSVNTVKPLIPSRTFEALTRESNKTSTPRTSQPVMKAAGSSMLSVEDPYAERFQGIPMIDSSKETYMTLFSTTSNSSYEKPSKKH